MRDDFPRPITYPPGLPITAFRDEIVSALSSVRPRVLIVTGETGCGKSTQIPKMCLDAGRALRGKIGITQPRRIAAVTIAARIAEELGEKPGESVGYKIRFQDMTSLRSVIKVMTDGILLAETQSDRLLRRYGTIIIDEAHERSLNIDFLLGIVRRLIDIRPELKVVITSATLDTEKFVRAFGHAPVIKVSGRSFPVAVEYRELPQEERTGPGKASGGGQPLERGGADYVEAAVDAVDYVRKEKEPGDILVFLPTEQDIHETCRILKGRRYPGTGILPLFSRLPAGDQRLVYTFAGQKIIVATNVAETSLTIPGIRYVIDTGLARIARYQPGTRIKSLPISKISRASADQRKGRAGRVREGLCVRLYPETDYLEREEFTPPEILRSDLAEVILRMSGLGLGDPLDFPFIDRPSAKAVRDGYETLVELGALRQFSDGGEPAAGDRTRTSGRTRASRHRGFELTQVGRIMAGMPLDPRLSRMLIQAAAEGALAEVAVIAAALSIRDPRERPPGLSAQADAAHAPFRHADSDFLFYLNIWHGFHGSDRGSVGNAMTAARKRAFCKDHFLSFIRMREWTYMYQEIISVVEEADIVGQVSRLLPGRPAGPKLKKMRPHRDISPVLYASIHRSILSGYLSNIAHLKEKNVYTAARGREVVLWPGSALYGKSAGWVVAAEVVRTSRLFARTAARIDPGWLEDIAGHLCKRIYYEPAWDRVRGEVTAKERVTVFGLEIVRDRKVSYGRIAPEEAQRIFVMSALVEGDMDDPPAFLRYNLALRRRIEKIQDKLRRRDLIIPEFRMAEFYSSRLPGIRDVRSLDRFLADHHDDGFLRMSEADITEVSLDQGLLSKFPDEMEIAGRKFPAEYKFSPGQEDDGITVRIPIPELSHIPSCRPEWSVPGRLPDLVSALIKGLPKRYRRFFQPLAEKVEAITEGMSRQPEEIPFVSSVAEFADRRLGLKIPAEAWKEAAAALPRHLIITVAAVDPESGEVLASGRDLELLRRKVGAASFRPSKLDSPAWLEARKNWEKSGYTDWDFDDLPGSIPVGATLKAYPGLTVSPGSRFELAVRLFPAAEEADLSHRRSVRALLERKFAKDLAFINRYFKIPAEYERAAGLFRGRENLERMVSEKILKQVLEVNIRTGLDFKACEADLNRKLFETGHVVLASTLMIITAVAEIRDRLKKTEEGQMKHSSGSQAGFGSLASIGRPGRVLAVPAYLDEIRTDLDQLIPEDFLTAYPVDRLKEIPRYLDALKARLERAGLDPEKDKAKSGQIAPYREGLERLIGDMEREERKQAAALSRRGTPAEARFLIQGRTPPAEKKAAVEQLRWMIEEFKISLFAPGIKTAFPVSAVRLARKIREIESMV